MLQASPRKAIFLLIVAIGLISVVDTACKYFTAEIHAVELVWGYFIGIFATLLVYFSFSRKQLKPLWVSNRIRLQLIRPGFLVASIISLFIGLTYLPIAEATVIGFMSPLFITVLASPILKEKVGAHRWLAVLIGLAGVAIMVRPGTDIWHWSAIMPLIGALFFAIYQLTTRLLAATEKTNTTLFYTGLGGVLWTSLLVPFFWTAPTKSHWLLFFGTGMMGALAHLCLVRAFELAEASLLAPFNYSKLIWVVALGYLVFGDLPDFWTLAGSTIIIASGSYVLYRETRMTNSAKTST